MKRFTGIVSDGEIREAISDLEKLSDKAPVISVAAIHVLKDELDPVKEGEESRRILFERRFSLPGSIGYRLRRRLRNLKTKDGSRNAGFGSRFMAFLPAWPKGRDAELFRDICDRYFWEEMVPCIEDGLGDLAHPFLNTINEAIINYAEYSFRRRSVFRSLSVQVFSTEGNLAYGIIRPHGLLQRAFDPLALKERKTPGALGAMHRGWGHTLLMQRALFISFDHSVKRRGMMIVVGPDDPE